VHGGGQGGHVVEKSIGGGVGMSLMRALVMVATLLVVRALVVVVMAVVVAMVVVVVVVTALTNVSQPNSSSYLTIICFSFAFLIF